MLVARIRNPWMREVRVRASFVLILNILPNPRYPKPLGVMVLWCTMVMQDS